MFVLRVLKLVESWKFKFIKKRVYIKMKTYVQGYNNRTTNCKTRTSTIAKINPLMFWTFSFSPREMCRSSEYEMLKEKEQIWRTDVSRFQDILESFNNQDCNGS